MINEMIENKQTAGEQILVSPSHIVQRQSSDVLATNDPEILKAILHIKKIATFNVDFFLFLSCLYFCNSLYNANIREKF